MPRNQLFIVSKAARLTLDPDEVKATCNALKELGLYALPYPEVDIWIAADGFASTTLDDQAFIKGHHETIMDYVREGKMVPSPDNPNKVLTNFGPGSWVEFRNMSLAHKNYTKAIMFSGNSYMNDCRVILSGPDEPDEHFADDHEAIVNGLICLLAARNVVKEVERHKAAGLGIGTKKLGKRSYEYVTTLSVPKDRPDATGQGAPGAEKAPHLRRGHIRHQHFGPNNELVKQIWIAPVFVNADKGWVASRRAYNLGSH